MYGGSPETQKSVAEWERGLNVRTMDAISHLTSPAAKIGKVVRIVDVGSDLCSPCQRPNINTVKKYVPPDANRDREYVGMPGVCAALYHKNRRSAAEATS